MSAPTSSQTPASQRQEHSLTPGATFHRCALQVNPHHYAASFRGQPAPGDALTHASAIVERATSLGISVLAITDHNDVSSVPAFQAAAENHAIYILPGFELGSSEGIHVLCIYSPECTQEQLGRFLGEFGITKPGPSADLSNKPFAEILTKVREQGGVTVAAHVTQDNGLLKQLDGKARMRAWCSDDLLAVQIPGRFEDLPPNFRDILENRVDAYRRPHPADENLAVAFVNAKDVTTADDLDDRSASCWIKMSEVSVEGLRQAFLDPGSRIRLNPLVPEEHAELISISWVGGFLDGVTIRLNPNLNVLVGGRGTGKSTVIESIRAVLGLDPVGEEARKAYDGIVKHVLQSATKISLVAKAHRPQLREYRIERTIPNPPLVRDGNNVSNLTPQDVLPRVEVFGQHEISELAKSPEKRTRLLDRFLDRDELLARRKSDLKRELERNRRALIESRNELRQIEEKLAALPGLEETLERFREAGLEEKLKERSLLIREERIVESVPERLAAIRESVETLKRETPFDRVFISEKALEGLPGRAILTRLNDTFVQLDKDLDRAIGVLEGALKKVDDSVAAVRRDWDLHRKAIETSYEKILRELQKSRVDGEEFIRLRKQIEALRPLRERQAAVRRAEKEHTEHRRTFLAEWEDLKAEEFRRFDRAGKEVGRKLRDRVQVEVTAAGIREPLLRLLREGVGGRLSEATDALSKVSGLSLTQFVEACRSGPEAVAKNYAIPLAQATRLASADPEVLMRVEELDLPPTTAIRLNTAPSGEPPDWQVLEELSTGQKATAVLLLLLLESDAPLIVDQPEDDLDNRFITEVVVPRMREEKQRRQFIFSTHNANIPVLGDAELIVGLSATGEAARIGSEHVGSIDAQSVRELVEEILEGGKEAFERRRRKYGF